MNILRFIIFIFLIQFSNYFIYNQTQSYLGLYNFKFLSNISEAISFYSTGLKREFGDLLFIRILQYYGKKSFFFDDYLSGYYPLMNIKVRDLVIVEPLYENAVLLSNTILAFGLKETISAKSNIRIALIQNKNNYKYLTLLAAVITYESNKKNITDEKTLLFLYETAVSDNSSDMFKNIVAFLCLKGGKTELAISLYKNIIKTSKDRYYIEKAIKKLKELGEI